MNKRNHHAAIFDLDGTLLEGTLNDLANAANTALHSARLPATSVAAYPSVRGNGLPYCPPGPARRGADRACGFRSTYWNARAPTILNWAVGRPYPHYPERLQELQRRSIPWPS